MDEEYIKLLVDLHLRQDRQGPGSEEQTVRATKLANLSKDESLKIADIGCGTGASTLQLASQLNADVTAVDFLPDFLHLSSDLLPDPINKSHVNIDDVRKELVTAQTTPALLSIFD